MVKKLHVDMLTRPEAAPAPAHRRLPPAYAGDISKLCSNCEHFRPSKSSRYRGDCRNGISGRLTTDASEKCEYGFYPSVERFPLRAGPGEIR
jgi:hypothetical protein